MGGLIAVRENKIFYCKGGGGRQQAPFSNCSKKGTALIQRTLTGGKSMLIALPDAEHWWLNDQARLVKVCEIVGILGLARTFSRHNFDWMPVSQTDSGRDSDQTS
ncbi:hypothetical protein AVEN_37789-1 [Araneus ventricosus]|uniref:Uncharacterized protein n=1 Tax=Araneus ventricosus TaxID=182803 RepID=A0A4Y2QKU1_ARAVE|nr:hypothetical protein AVEN_242629-1 [Araneus ventricosus]GBN63913.1 hypothetical protein AVEN_37789-1 [Araneus ventricosus]